MHSGYDYGPEDLEAPGVSERSRLFQPWSIDDDTRGFRNRFKYPRIGRTYRKIKARTSEALRTWGFLDWLGFVLPCANTCVAWLRTASIPNIFPPTAPRADRPLSHGFKSAIARLQQYVQHNPDKISKISKKLTKRIKRSLTEERLGFASIGVYAYIDMLDKSVLPDSSYTMNYFTKELIHIPDALISTLINGPLAVAQALGAKLLASYIHAQDNVENQVTAVDQLMQSVLCQMLGRVDLGPHRPNDMQAGSGDHRQNAAWIGRMQEDCKAAWMLCIQEYILLCHRLNIVPDYLEEVVECILENLDLSSRGVQEILMQQKTFSALGFTGILLSDAADLALMSFRCLQPFVHDMSSTYRVLETAMRYLDRDGRWGSEHVVVNLLGLIRHACGDHTFPLFTTLLRHCSAEGLTTQQRKIIVGYTSQWGSTHSLSAISHALTELPKALAAADMKPQTANQTLLRTPDQILLLEEVIATMRTLALNVGNVDELCDALAGALRRHASSSTLTQVSAMAVECCLAALNVIPEFPHQGRTFSLKGFPSLLIQQLGPYLVGAAACEDPELEAGVRRSSLCCLLCILPLAILGAGVPSLLGAGVQAKPNSFSLAEMPTQSSHHTGYALGRNHSSFSHTSTASQLQANLSSHDQHNGDLHRSSDALFQAAGSTVKSASSITCGSQPQTSPEGITSLQLDSRLCSQSMMSTHLLSSAPLPHTPLAPELSDGVVTCAPDERTALSLLSMACALACEGAAGPKELEGASWLTAAAATCLSPHVQLQLARLLLALRGMFLLKETSSWSSVRVSGGLLLAECMLQQLRLSARCTLLSQLLVPGQVLEQPELNFVWTHRSDVLHTSLGVGSRELVIPVLSAKCERFEATPGAESKARVGVKVLLSGAVAWADAFVNALQAEGLLHRAYGESLSKHMSEAFNTNAFSAPLLRTMATPSTPLSSHVSAAEAAAGSSPAASIMAAETSRQQKHYSIQGSKGGDSATSMSATLPPSLAVTRGAAAGSDELRLLMPREAADPGSALQSALTEIQQSSEISVVMSPVDLLPQRVKAAAWGGRQASWTGREQMIGGPAAALNLAQVLGILEEEQQQQQQQSLGPLWSSGTVAVTAEDDDVGTSLQYSTSSANRYPACFTYDQKDNTMLKSRGGVSSFLLEEMQDLPYDNTSQGHHEQQCDGILLLNSTAVDAAGPLVPPHAAQHCPSSDPRANIIQISIQEALHVLAETSSHHGQLHKQSSIDRTEGRGGDNISDSYQTCSDNDGSSQMYLTRKDQDPMGTNHQDPMGTNHALFKADLPCLMKELDPLSV